VKIQKLSSPEEAAGFIALANSLHPLSDGAAQFLIDHSYTISIKKGRILQKGGSICSEMFFVKKGVLRGFIKDKNREITTWITSEGELVSAIRSFILQIPTEENIGNWNRTLHDCDWVIKYSANQNQIEAAVDELIELEKTIANSFIEESLFGSSFGLRNSIARVKNDGIKKIEVMGKAG
jgi:hypothetical protein